MRLYFLAEIRFLFKKILNEKKNFRKTTMRLNLQLNNRK